MLDVGCGRGDLARPLLDYVERVDAVDWSDAMIATGRTLPGGNHPNLRWVRGRIEDVPLQPPYALITAGESVHWMDWDVILPRFSDVLTAHGYLALTERLSLPLPWDTEVQKLIIRFSTLTHYQPYDVIAMLQQSGLFEKIGERTTAPAAFTQSVDDYIESFHSRSSLARASMTAEAAAQFDAELRRLLDDYCKDGMVAMRVVGSIVWGNPGRPAARQHAQQ